MAVIIFVVLPL